LDGVVQNIRAMIEIREEQLTERSELSISIRDVDRA
jgi:hypothetical protein